MRGVARALSVPVAAALVATGGAYSPTAQPRVTVAAPGGDPLPTAIPAFTVRAGDFDPADRPITLTLQLSDRQDFSGTLLFEQSADGDSAKFQVTRPLPSATTIWWRARARTARGQTVLSEVAGPRLTTPWIRLLEPNPVGGSTLDTRRPRFIWSATTLPSPPAPWSFGLIIDNMATGESRRIPAISDTTYSPTHDLESNTSYRWGIVAHLATGDSAVVRSKSSFVISDPGTPAVTLLYQNFPNPFPSPLLSTTCIWFDVHVATRVSLTILDIRGNRIRTLIPSGAVGGAFLPGRYGRGAVGGNTGCDPRFSWDGKADDGTVVASGVYLIRLKTDTYLAFKKALFRGR